MEAPECPVCLKGYSDGGGLVPRVLSCGHSACEACLLRLPWRFPDTVRCPACTQLVRYPPNPSALPKNIDILRFSLPPHPRTTNPQVVNPKPTAAPQEGEDPHPHLVPSSVFAILGMQICESLIGLQSQGLVAGSLGLSCFQFDGLGHPHLDLNVIAAYARKLSDCAALENASAPKLVLVPSFGLLLSRMLQSHFFVSTEVLLELVHREGMDVEIDELKHSIGDAQMLGP